MPAGYDSCSGCGRLFKQDNVAEQVVLDTHSCEWSDEVLGLKIKQATVKRLTDRENWTFDQFVFALNQAHCPTTWRSGQHAFNFLWAVRPDIAEKVRGTMIDPFHRDDALPAFYKFVEENW